ncbi:heavy-metal-associated domain-containing protein [Nocardiopsis alba]|uniref:heavy-metal-associated domain-containing protein n=1 Tax=Nocardiopsis alba TaxID=53437 RepID=UPI003406746D
MCTTCSCSTDSAGSTAATEDARTYEVEGMTCGHCVNSVSTEIGKVSGVTDVTVDLAEGRGRVEGSDFGDAEIRAAVEEAGYKVVGA